MGRRLPNYVFPGSFAACHALMYFRHPSTSVRKQRCLLRKARDLLSAAGSWWLECNAYILLGVGFLCKWAVVGHQLSAEPLRPNVTNKDGFLQWSFSWAFFFFFLNLVELTKIKAFLGLILLINIKAIKVTMSLYYCLLSKKKTQLWDLLFTAKPSMALSS